MADLRKDILDFVNDERKFEKETYLFREVWGIDPKTGFSVNSLTKNTTYKNQDGADILVGEKSDPLSQGISLDLQNENPYENSTNTNDGAGTIISNRISAEKEFPPHTLFRLKELSMPITVKSEIKFNHDATEDGDVEISQNTYDKIVRLYELHKSSSYSMSLYVENEYQEFTWPNSKFLAKSGRDMLPIQTKFYTTSASENASWNSNTDFKSRIPFQLDRGALYGPEKRAFDTRHFSFDSGVEVKTGETKHKRNGLEYTPRSELVPCHFDKIRQSWLPFNKEAYTKEIAVTLLSRNLTEVFPVLDTEKFFNPKNIKWCVDVNRFRPNSAQERNPIYEPVYEIEYLPSPKDSFVIRYVLDKRNERDMATARLFTRYFDSKSEVFGETDNALILHQGKLKRVNFLSDLTPYLNPNQLLKGRREFAYVDDVIKGGTYAQYSHNRRDYDYHPCDKLDPVKDESAWYMKNPQVRRRRTLIAYNEVTKELVVQCFPQTEDHYRKMPHDAKVNNLQYQQWFLNHFMVLTGFTGNDVPPLKGSKRHIFSTSYKNMQSPFKYHRERESELKRFSEDKCPLFHLELFAESEKDTKGEELKYIKAKLYCFLEYLGFKLYGEPDVLLDLERFLREFVTANDRIKAHEEQAKMGFMDHRFLTVNNAKDSTAKFFYDGQLQSLKSIPEWIEEYVYKMINICDKEEVKKNIRNITYAKELQNTISKVQKEYLKWIKTNDFDKYPHYMEVPAHFPFYQLVFRPVTATVKDEKGIGTGYTLKLQNSSEDAKGVKINDLLQSDASFGLVNLTAEQKKALYKYDAQVFSG